ncbi:MAG: NADH-quinone oxidoreductase subunit M [Planctomycetes bacterium]|nr:NADH-quinone oxidoreductase subunit M [Planctomycetota bacterium]
MKRAALLVTVLVFALTAWMAIPDGESGSGRFGFSGGVAIAEMQNTFNEEWIPSFDIEYYMGIDGISFPLILLTSFISMLSMWASWPINKHVKAYCILFLLLETGMLGVFMSLDFFLFYVFWEVMLLPMYFLIGVWGGPRREYAAIKFFLFTLVGSVLMLIAILMLYFNTDLKTLSPDQLQAAHVVDASLTGEALTAAVNERVYERPQAEVHTFNLLALRTLGQNGAFDDKLVEDGWWIFGASIGHWAFVLLLIGFIIKVPSVPFHTWLPDAHVEAPTPISMILAGVLLKMGGYGIIRICYPICPQAGYDLAYWVCGLGVVSMVYGAFAAMAQKDFKRLVAYSSVSHMGYVLLGLGVWSTVQGNAEYWAMGMNGAMFQMIGHGISSAGMFFLVGVIYDRVHHRNLDEFGGLFAKMPIYSGLAMGIFFAGLGLPGLCGFIGEVLVTLSVWRFSIVLAVISASVVILTAGYILWTIQRVYLGPEYKGPNADKIRPADAREITIAGTLLAFAILFGVFPQLVFNYMEPTVTQQAKDLSQWRIDEPQRRIKEARRKLKNLSKSVSATNPQTPTNEGLSQDGRPDRKPAPRKLPEQPSPEAIATSTTLKTESDTP